MREIITKIISVLEEHGYKEYELPMWFSWDALRLLLPHACGTATIKLIDGQGGVMALRSDFTAAVALGLDSEHFTVPQKLAYAGPVYRIERGECVSSEEVGCESIGNGGIEDDLEILSILVECLQRVCINRVTVAINNVAVFKNLIAPFGISAQQELLASAKRRSIAGLRNALSELGERGHGLATNVFNATSPDCLSRYLPDSCQPELEKLQSVYDMLLKLGVSVCFDPSLVREPDYYTGLVFELYAPGVPQALGGGGRYDQLIKGPEGYVKAAGFSVNLKALKRAQSRAALSLAYELSGNH